MCSAFNETKGLSLWFCASKNWRNSASDSRFDNGSVFVGNAGGSGLEQMQMVEEIIGGTPELAKFN